MSSPQVGMNRNGLTEANAAPNKTYSIEVDSGR
jgi:hypothetical protein